MDTQRFTDWTASRVIVQPRVILLSDAPVAETPAQHVRNALTVLSLLEQQSPAVWAFNAELPRAQRRAEAALVMLELGGPPPFAEIHLRRAIETLAEEHLDWETVPAIPTVVVRLFRAWFSVLVMLDAERAS